MADPEPPGSKSSCAFRSEALLLAIANAGTTVDKTDCPRCLKKRSHQHRQNNAAVAMGNLSCAINLHIQVRTVTKSQAASPEMEVDAARQKTKEERRNQRDQVDTERQQQDVRSNMGSSSRYHDSYDHPDRRSGERPAFGSQYGQYPDQYLQRPPPGQFPSQYEQRPPFGQFPDQYQQRPLPTQYGDQYSRPFPDQLRPKSGFYEDQYSRPLDQYHGRDSGYYQSQYQNQPPAPHQSQPTPNQYDRFGYGSPGYRNLDHQCDEYRHRPSYHERGRAPRCSASPKDRSKQNRDRLSKPETNTKSRPDAPQFRMADKLDIDPRIAPKAFLLQGRQRILKARTEAYEKAKSRSSEKKDDVKMAQDSATDQSEERCRLLLARLEKRDEEIYNLKQKLARALSTITELQRQHTNQSNSDIPDPRVQSLDDQSPHIKREPETVEFSESPATKIKAEP